MGEAGRPEGAVKRAADAAPQPAPTPALRVRRVVGSVFSWFHPDEADLAGESYRNLLEARLSQALSDLKTAKEQGDPARVEAEKGAVFVIATGLATFGDLDRAIVALDHLPDSRRIQPLAGTLPGFLPLPPDLDPKRDPVAAAGWLRAHRAWLRWVPDSHFALEAEG